MSVSAMRKFPILLAICIASTAFAQETAFFSDAERDYHRGKQYFDHLIHSRAFIAFGDFQNSIYPDYRPDYKLLRTYAEFEKAESAIQAGSPQADKLMVKFIEKYQPDPVASDAIMVVGNFYFHSRKFDQAITYFNMIDGNDVSPEIYAEARFKTGYSHFVKEEYKQAEASFAGMRNIESAYYNPANYYYGICRFIHADYESAIESFRKIADADQYKAEVPYYTTLLYFAMGDYTNAAKYGNEALDNRRTRDTREISHIVGQSYFEMGDYEDALPYLETYNAQVPKMTVAEFYQLGFAQYATGNCDRAVETFKNIAGENDEFGLRANFYIGVCQLRAGKTQEARNAFRSVSRNEIDPELRQEAAFNFGKLSAQLDYDSDAIHTLNAIEPTSQYYGEAQRILKDIFRNTRDYATSIMTLEGVSELSPTMKEAYQELSLKLGLQNLRDGMPESALVAFQKAGTYPVNPMLTAQAVYWRADIMHNAGNYSESRELFNRFFTLARTTADLPVESSVALANYTQGYNYLYDEKYGMALEQFKNSISEIEANSSLLGLKNADMVLADAQTRSADCLFKLGRHKEAKSLYSSVIDQNGYGSVYSTYQKAIILGLEGEQLDKILLLESITQNHPQSQYADDALFQAAVTNQEIGNSQRALQQYESLSQNYPNSEYISQTRLRMGLISYNNGDLSSAIGYYKNVFATNPAPAEAQEALTALEEIYVHDLSQPQEYIAFAESVPGYSVSALQKDSITYRAAEFLYENGQYEKAEISFQNYISQYPNGAYAIMALYYRGESLALLKKYGDALTSYDAVVDKGPSSYYVPALKKSASLSYHGARDFRLASEYYSKLTVAVTDPIELYDAHLGNMRSAFRTDNFELTAASARYLLGVEQTPAEIESEAHFYLAKAAMNKSDYDNAIVHLNDVIELSDNVMTAEARYTMAWIYFDRQQYDLSEQICHNANRANANYPYWVAKGLILLSDIYAGREDYFNAKAPLEAILENFTGETEIVEEANKKLADILYLEQQASRVKSDDAAEIKDFNPDENE